MSSTAAAAAAGGQLPGAATAHAKADITPTTNVPFLIREPLFAPVHNCPPAVSEMFEVARIHHDDGELERSIEVYGLAMAKWEELGAELKLTENNVNKDQVQQQRVDFHAQASQAIDAITHQVHSVHSVMSAEDKAAEISREVQVWEEREQQLMQSIAEKQAETLSVGVHALVPVEGRIYFHLAVGSVMDTAGLDEHALREYLEALRLLREQVPIFHTQLMTATVYTCLGVVYFHLSQYDFAADYFFRALEIREDNLPPSHVDTASTLNNVAATLIALNRIADSLILLSKAKAIFQEQLPSHHSRNWILKMNEELARKRGVSTDAVFHAVPFELGQKPPMIKGARSIVVARETAKMQKEAAAAAKLKDKQKGKK